MAASRIVLISGCSTGIGLFTALLLASDPEKRFKVYATMRNLEKKSELEERGRECLDDSLIIKQMDVSFADSVKSLVDEVLAKEGKIAVLSKYSLDLTLWTTNPVKALLKIANKVEVDCTVIQDEISHRKNIYNDFSATVNRAE